MAKLSFAYLSLLAMSSFLGFIVAEPMIDTFENPNPKDPNPNIALLYHFAAVHEGVDSEPLTAAAAMFPIIEPEA
jgi:hypothetical protein